MNIMRTVSAHYRPGETIHLDSCGVSLAPLTFPPKKDFGGEAWTV